jgi:hypothetical protein
MSTRVLNEEYTDIMQPLSTQYEKSRFYYYKNKMYQLGLQSTKQGYRVYSGIYKESAHLILPDFHTSTSSEMLWCMATFREELCILYSCYPLVIGSIDDNHTLSIRHIHYDVPLFFKDLYTTTNSVPWKGTQWVIFHKPTQYIWNEKTYFKQEYIFVVFNSSLEIIKYSNFFTAEGLIWDLQIKEEGVHFITSKMTRSVYAWDVVDKLIWNYKESL